MDLLEKGKPSFWDEKLTEDERIDRQDLFFLEFTPQWFTFTGWLLLIGALEYLRQETASHPVILVLLVISYLTLYNYLTAILFNTHFYRIVPSRYIKNGKWARKINVLLAGVLYIPLVVFLPDIVKLLIHN